MITVIDQHTALVLIDLQKGIVQGSTVHPVTAIVSNAVALIDAFRKHRLTVVIVNVNPAGGPLTKLRTNASMTAAQQPMADFDEIIPEIDIQPGDVLITKKTWNAFYDTALDEVLQEKNITQIVLAGMSTSIGVEGTARSAGERGYHIAFATDAMTDRIASAHEHSINIIFPRIGELGTTQEIIGMLP